MQLDPNYKKDTKFFMDNNFGENQIDGRGLAEKLHKDGFKKLYLFSGTEFGKGEVPDYLTVILKTDIDSLCKVIEAG